MLLVIACNNSKVEYFSNGEISKEYSLRNNKYDGEFTEYFIGGEKKAIHHYSMGVLTDSSLYFQNNKIWKVDYHFKNDTILSKILFDNSKTREEGRYHNGMKIGKWKYYTKNGSIDKIFEYINLNGKQFTNQGWYFDEKGDTIKDFGNYFSFEISPATVKINEIMKIKFKYKPILALNSNVIACMSFKIKEDFSNLNTVHLDTTYFERTTSGYQEIIFSKKGKQHIRGFIKEFYETDEKFVEKKMYIDIPITVY